MAPHTRLLPTARGAGVIPLDEPWLRNDPEAAKRYAVKAINRALQISIEAAQPKLDLGVLRDLAGKKILLGVLDLGDNAYGKLKALADGAAIVRRELTE